MDEELLEKMRQIGLVISANGDLFHQGQKVDHPRLATAIRRWLDVLDDGRTIVRMDEKRYAYAKVEDAHLIVLSANPDGNNVTLRLNDDTTEPLAPETLMMDSKSGALYCRVRGGTLLAKFSTAAQHSLAQLIAEEDEEFFLRLGGRDFHIGQRQRDGEAGST